MPNFYDEDNYTYPLDLSEWSEEDKMNWEDGVGQKTRGWR